jgi:uncharacterized protein YjdB
VNRVAAAVLAAVIGGCGSLPTTSEDVAFLEIRPPATLIVDVGDTLHFGARALDKAGNPVDVTVHWRTPDTTISVGDTTGLVVGLAEGTGRLQAYIGDDELVSDLITITVNPAATSAGRSARPSTAVR